MQFLLHRQRPRWIHQVLLFALLMAVLRTQKEIFFVKDQRMIISTSTTTQIEASTNNSTSDSRTPSSSPSSSPSSKEKQKDLMVIDCFPYNGEHIVAARLTVLNPHVDLFFISEPPFTFSGIKKERLFKDINAEVFEPYKNKIIWVDTEKLQSESLHQSAWQRERAQRNEGVAAFRRSINEGRLTEPFVVLNTDADEIPNPSIIHKVMPEQSLYDKILQGPIFLNMKMFYYNFNWFRGEWHLATLVHSNHLLEQNLSLEEIRMSHDRTDTILVNDGGWHCSFCMSVEDIINKLRSFSHQEYNKEPYTSRGFIQDCISNGKDIFKRSTPLKSYLNSTQYLPEELQEFNKALVLTQI